MDNDKVIPIIDCPNCKEKDVPLSYEGTMVKEGFPEIVIWQCTSCGSVPNILDEVKVKKWVSIKELEEMGY